VEIRREGFVKVELVTYLRYPALTSLRGIFPLDLEFQYVLVWHPKLFKAIITRNSDIRCRSRCHGQQLETLSSRFPKYHLFILHKGRKTMLLGLFFNESTGNARCSDRAHGNSKLADQNKGNLVTDHYIILLFYLPVMHFVE
jgi:hypothetical protein